jgi:hypothetical protein
VKATCGDRGKLVTANDQNRNRAVGLRRPHAKMAAGIIAPAIGITLYRQSTVVAISDCDAFKDPTAGDSDGDCGVVKISISKLS